MQPPTHHHTPTFQLYFYSHFPQVIAIDNFVNAVVDPTGATDYPESLLRVQKLAGKSCAFHKVWAGSFLYMYNLPVIY